MNHNVVDCDSGELVFKDNPRLLERLRADVFKGRDWLWHYKGMCGMLHNAVLTTALEAYDDHQMKQDRREPIPEHVGKFFWGQTVPTDEEGRRFDRD